MSNTKRTRITIAAASVALIAAGYPATVKAHGLAHAVDLVIHKHFKVKVEDLPTPIQRIQAGARKAGKASKRGKAKEKL